MNIIATDPNDLPLIREVYHKFRQPNGHVDWTAAQASHPDLFEKLGRGRTFAAVKQVFARAMQNKDKKKSEGSSKWPADDLALVQKLAAKYTDLGSGKIKWSETRDDPDMRTLLTRHTFTDITSRYHYALNYPKYKKAKEQGGRRLTQQESGRLGGLARQKNRRAKSEPVMRYHYPKPIEPIPADPAPAPPATQLPTRGSINFCPYCGHDIKNLVG